MISAINNFRNGTRFIYKKLSTDLEHFFISKTSNGKYQEYGV